MAVYFNGKVIGSDYGEKLPSSTPTPSTSTNSAPKTTSTSTTTVSNTASSQPVSQSTTTQPDWNNVTVGQIRAAGYENLTEYKKAYEKGETAEPNVIVRTSQTSSGTGVYTDTRTGERVAVSGTTIVPNNIFPSGGPTPIGSSTGIGSTGGIFTPVSTQESGLNDDAESAIQQGNIISRIASGENVSAQEKKAVASFQTPQQIYEKGTFGLSSTSGTIMPVESSDLVLYGGLAKVGVNLAGVGLKVAAPTVMKTFSGPAMSGIDSVIGMGSKGAINFAGKSGAYSPIAQAAKIIKSENVESVIPKAWTSSTGIYSPIGKVTRSITSGLGSQGASMVKAIEPVVQNRFFLPAVSIGTSIAAPEVTVALKTGTTSKPNINVSAEQMSLITAAEFETAQLESVYQSNTTTKQYEKDSKLITETTEYYTPRPEVWGVDVPVFGRVTAYSIFPSIAVDVFTGGLYTKGAKKGGEKKALELGFTESEAKQLAEYSWTTQVEARSQGELIGMVPGTIGGEALGQALVTRSVGKGLSEAGISQIGKTFYYTAGKDAGKVATQEAGKIIGKQSIVPLAIAGMAEGGTFGYLSGQAQGQQGIQLGLSIAFGAAAGGVSAPFFGAPVAKWAVTRPTTAKIAMGGLYVADYTEVIGDFGQKKLGKIISKEANYYPIKTVTKTPTLSFAQTTPTSTLTTTKNTSTAVFNDTTIPTQNQTPIQDYVFNIVTTPVSTSTKTTVTETPTTTATQTQTFITTMTTSNTPTSIFTPTFTPNIPLFPGFGLPGDNAFLGGTGKAKPRKYYNEIEAAFGSFRGLDYLYSKPRKKRRTVNVGGKTYKIGKLVKVKKK